jgi:hypothetical protein
MSDRAQHCPFLNRTDDRCSTNFSLDRLDRAFEHCFGVYGACPVYLELLAERQLRRATGAGHDRAALSLNANERPGHGSRWQSDNQEAGHDATHGSPYVQLTFAHRHSEHAA